jgi:fumarate reductase flavoprotein subunit
LEISNSKISNITIDSLNQVTDHTRWGYYVNKAIKDIPKSVISRQSIEIDAISGATNTSNAILLAIARAIEKALN